MTARLPSVRSPSWLAAWLLLPLLALGSIPAAADEPSPPTVAPPGPMDPEEAGPPVVGAARLDPLVYLGLLARQLEQHTVPPPKGEDRTLYDAWQPILESRSRRMVGRVRRLLETRRWIPTCTDIGCSLRLLSTQWPDAIKELTLLHGELAGALEQYNRVAPRPVDVPPPSGVPSITSLQGKLHDLQHREERLREQRRLHRPGWEQEVAGYVSMLAAYNAELLAFQDLLDRYAVAAAQGGGDAGTGPALTLKRETLKLQMLSVKALTAALQVIEEDHLLRAMQPLDDRERGLVAGQLAVMREARMTAEALPPEPSTRYGHVLATRWLPAQQSAWKRIARVPGSPDDFDASEDLPETDPTRHEEPEAAEEPTEPEPQEPMPGEHDDR